MFGLISVRLHKQELERQSNNLWSHFDMWLNNFKKCQEELKLEKRKVELLKTKLAYYECKVTNPDAEPCIVGDELALMYIKGNLSLEGAVPVNRVKL